MSMYILGISAYHADASAALVADGRLVAAAEEERFNRIKHAAGFPAAAIRYCLEEAGISIREVDHVAVPRNPRARLARKLIYAVRLPRFAADRARVLRRVGSIEGEIAGAVDADPREVRARVHRVEHHVAHLASSFFVSPFDSAALLSLDGLGDFASGMWGVGEGNRMRVMGSVAFPHSIGLYYTALTQYLGFWKFGDEYKVMGLAAYGQPAYADVFRRMMRTRDGLGYRLDLGFFRHHREHVSMTWEEGEPSLGRLFSEGLERALGPRRDREEEIADRHRDVASSMQKRLQEVLFHQWRSLAALTSREDLAYAGGVAFNCVANGQIFRETPFRGIYVPPAAGDAGLSVGAAFYVYHQVLGFPRSFVMDHAYWGPSFSDGAIRTELERHGLRYREVPEDLLCREVAKRVAEGDVVGWFQGRMELGPRALGNRSIVVDPRRPEMKEILNRRIKRREPFRPFAPSILGEATAKYFDESYPSPFMLMTYRVRPDKRATIPAPTHVDGTGRLQTVSREANPLYWRLIKEVGDVTGVPVVLNTSFNENEPVVCTPREAIECFRRTRMDVLAIGRFLVVRDGASS